MPSLNKFIAKELAKNDFRVAIFGSARIKPKDKIYKQIYTLAKGIGNLGADVVTGGGPGLMDAAAAGHQASSNKKGESIGLNIKLPFEQENNKHLDMYQNFDTFSSRLDTFVLLSNVAVIAPGGVGTCLEFFYVWQLMQVNHSCKIPILMIGNMWKSLIKWIKKYPLKDGLLSPENLETIVLIDSCDEALQIIKHAYAEFEKAGPEMCLNLRKYGKKLHINDVRVTL